MSNYRVHEFAKRIGKSTSTVRRWDREGKLVASRTPTGERYYTQEDVQKALGVAPTIKKVVVYCRVSSSNQKADLSSQVQAMETFCLNGGIAVDEWIEEIGSGLNFKRKKFLTLIQQVENGEIGKIVLAHKDRLVRFGFDYFQYFSSQHGCELIVANQRTLSPEQEMVEDLLAIVHCFSSRLYGLRKYKKTLKEEFSNDESN